MLKARLYRRVATLCAILWLGGAGAGMAQVTPPTVALSVTSSSASATLPSYNNSNGYALFQNDGSVELSYQLASTAAGAPAVTPGPTVPTIEAGGCRVVFIGPFGGFVGAATVTGSTTLKVTLQISGPAPASCPGAAGSGSVSLTGPLPAGTNGIGNVGGKTTMVCVTPTVTASNAYGANYVVGGKLTFANAFTTTGTGILQDVVVTIKDLETSGFTFFPFNSDPSATTWTDAAVAAINAIDVPKVRGPVPLAGNIQLGASGFSTQYAYGLGHTMAPTATSLFGVLLANAPLTTNFAGASDVQVCVKVLNDL